MLKLHGFSISPNHNKVKLALLEKGIEFEEVMQRPSQDETFLVHSPMGKIPTMEVDGKFFSESGVILEYLENAYPAAPLMPMDPVERAKCRELMQVIELYMSGSSASGRLTAAAFFGAPISDEAKNDAEALIERGVKAVARLAKFSPFLTGAKFTLADCVAFPQLSTVAWVTRIVLGKNMVDGIPGAADYLKYVAKRPAVQKILADQQRAMELFMASVKK
ncbi:MAG: glutathione S-transferase family protein [Pseudomonadota bacterium]|nr:glutathione S-transferase family protein [Pseudomonadota bacterium]